MILVNSCKKSADAVIKIARNAYTNGSRGLIKNRELAGQSKLAIIPRGTNKIRIIVRHQQTNNIT